jgi:hypothetical protein
VAIYVSHEGVLVILHRQKDASFWIAKKKPFLDRQNLACRAKSRGGSNSVPTCLRAKSYHLGHDGISWAERLFLRAAPLLFMNSRIPQRKTDETTFRSHFDRQEQ